MDKVQNTESGAAFQSLTEWVRFHQEMNQVSDFQEARPRFWTRTKETESEER